MSEINDKLNEKLRQRWMACLMRTRNIDFGL